MRLSQLLLSCTRSCASAHCDPPARLNGENNERRVPDAAEWGKYETQKQVSEIA